DPDIVFDLANRRATEGEAVDWKAKHIGETIFQWNGVKKLRVCSALHALYAHAALDSNWQHHFFETQIGRIGGIERHKDRVIFVVLLQHGEMNLRVVVAGEPNEAALPSLLGGLERFDCTSWREDLLDFVHRADLVNLPKIHMIGLQGAQGFFYIRFRAFTAAFWRLGRQKNILAKRREYVAVDLFGFSIPINASCIEVINTKFIGAQRNRLRVFVTAHRKPSAGLADDGEFFAGFTKDTLWDLAGFQLIGFIGERTDSEAGGRGCRKKCSSSHDSSSISVRDLRPLYPLDLALVWDNHCTPMGMRFFNLCIAIGLFASLGHAQDDRLRALYQHAKSAEQSGDYKSATADYDKIIQLRPDMAEAYANAGNLYYLQGEIPQAKAYFRKAISLKPQLPGPHFFLGILDFKARDYRGALN